MKGCFKRIAQTAGVITLLVVVMVVIAIVTAPGGGAPPTAEPTITATSTPLPTMTLAPSPTPTLAWYAGGTLHNATLAEWKAADDRNKLATAADWAAQSWDSVANLKEHATALWACVDKMAETASDASSVTDLAVGCVVMLKGQ